MSAVPDAGVSPGHTSALFRFASPIVLLPIFLEGEGWNRLDKLDKAASGSSKALISIGFDLIPFVQLPTGQSRSQAAGKP
jgi:hypothetical protein